MTRPYANNNQYQVAWNGLVFFRPADWDVVVVGPQHLLIEEGLQPVIELRWDTTGHRTVPQVASRVMKMSVNHSAMRQVGVPAPLFKCNLPEPTVLSSRRDDQPEILLWQCKSCGTILFVHLHRPCHGIPELAPLLSSLICHQQQEEGSLWALQDFRLRVPADYHYLDSSFDAGLSRLAFTGNGMQLQFCRLAPASVRLAGSTLGELLTAMAGAGTKPAVVIDTGECYEGMVTPGTWQRLFGMLKRKPLFFRGRIWHLAQHDRLLSLIISARRPIHADTFHNLARHYEIVPLQTTTDPTPAP